MKKLIRFCVICSLCFLLVGCGAAKKEDSSNNNGNNDKKNNYNENTKVGTISDSYEKYTTLKSKSYELLSDGLEESGSFKLSMGILGFATVDLSLIPLTFCGLESEQAILGLKFLYQDVDYKSSKDSCDLTLKTKQNKDDESESFTYNTKYDEKTDSLQTKVYVDGKLHMISEYIKLDEGYATQFYFINEDDDDETTTYKSIFDSKKIIVGMESKKSEPESIFKNANIANETWTKSQELWSKYENGKTTSIYDGKEY